MITTVAFLVPSSSKNRDWSSFKETYLNNYLLESVVKTKGDDFIYALYVGFDCSDKLYLLQNFICDMKNECKKRGVCVDITVFEDSIEPGHLTKMWNILFKKAYADGCDYFVQCGDDVELLDNNWVIESVGSLKTHQNMGMIGPADIDYPRILTQTMVSRVHMEIFGFYFPEEIINWYCDDWINFVYRGCNLAHKPIGRCVNRGGSQRYDIVREMPMLDYLIQRDVEKIKLFVIQKNVR